MIWFSQAARRIIDCRAYVGGAEAGEGLESPPIQMARAKPVCRTEDGVLSIVVDGMLIERGPRMVAGLRRRQRPEAPNGWAAAVQGMLGPSPGPMGQ